MKTIQIKQEARQNQQKTPNKTPNIPPEAIKQASISAWVKKNQNN